MEKLLGAHKTLIQAEANITTARLGITRQCSDDKRALLNGWLKRMAASPALKKTGANSELGNDHTNQNNTGQYPALPE